MQNIFGIKYLSYNLSNFHCQYFPALKGEKCKQTPLLYAPKEAETQRLRGTV